MKKEIQEVERIFLGMQSLYIKLTPRYAVVYEAGKQAYIAGIQRRAGNPYPSYSDSKFTNNCHLLWRKGWEYVSYQNKKDRK